MNDHKIIVRVYCIQCRNFSLIFYITLIPFSTVLFYGVLSGNEIDTDWFCL